MIQDFHQIYSAKTKFVQSLNFATLIDYYHVDKCEKPLCLTKIIADSFKTNFPQSFFHQVHLIRP